MMTMFLGGWAPVDAHELRVRLETARSKTIAELLVFTDSGTPNCVECDHGSLSDSILIKKGTSRNTEPPQNLLKSAKSLSGHAEER